MPSDDFTFVGNDEDLDWFEDMISKEFEVKVRGRLGIDKEDIKSIRILSRVVEWTEEVIWYEADQRATRT